MLTLTLNYTRDYILVGLAIEVAWLGVKDQVRMFTLLNPRS